MDVQASTIQRAKAFDAYAFVGRTLKRLRLEKGLTQAQAAQIISVSPQQYQKYEEAHTKCSLNYLIAFADHYGVDVNTFLPSRRSDLSSKDVDPIKSAASEADLLARLVSSFVQLDDFDEKLRLVQLVEAIGKAHEKPLER